ncbi:MAG: fructosamine kinase family protein [Ferruginibacter sp.]
MSIQPIIDHCGLRVNSYETVTGGDINRAYCLYTGDAKYFLKVNDARLYPLMFEKEAAALEAFHNRSTIVVPSVINCATINGNQYLLLEWLERGPVRKDSWQKFGEYLALLHQQPQPFFGWDHDNFIGSLVQRNQQFPAWDLFYSECRIMPLVKELFNQHIFSITDVESAELFCKKLGQLFPLEPAAMLHGDLWSGNYLITVSGDAAFFDPAVYCGHREMDIGMTNLFGGFNPQFYDSYQETYPLENGWRQRLPLTQLYPLLVHAVLFGGHYINSARGIIRHFSGG